LRKIDRGVETVGLADFDLKSGWWGRGLNILQRGKGVPIAVHDVP